MSANVLSSLLTLLTPLAMLASGSVLSTVEPSAPMQQPAVVSPAGAVSAPCLGQVQADVPTDEAALRYQPVCPPAG